VTRRHLATLALLGILALWPSHAAGDVPATAGRIPASEFQVVISPRAKFEPVRSSGDPSASGQHVVMEPATPPASNAPSPRARKRLAAVHGGVGSAPQTPVPTVTGTASWMPERYGPLYLALPGGAGSTVRICAARCMTMTSTDAGPDLAMQRAGRVADIGVLSWAWICGRDRSIGLCRVSVEVLP
jgi:hypothetical protein